jgi:hypothetical protein
MAFNVKGKFGGKLEVPAVFLVITVSREKYVRHNPHQR